MTKLPVLIIIVAVIIVGGYFLVRPDNSIKNIMNQQTQEGLAKIGEKEVSFQDRDVVKGTIKTNKGEINIELYPKNAPTTTTVFATLAINNFYNGILVHRVVPDFVVQFGDPITKESGINDPRVGSGNPGFSFKDEINLASLGAPADYIQRLEAKGYTYQNDIQSLLVETGVLAMANSGPNTNGSQIFIVTNGANAQHLNGLHTVFGRVTKESMAIVSLIEPGDVIEGIEIEL